MFKEGPSKDVSRWNDPGNTDFLRPALSYPDLLPQSPDRNAGLRITSNGNITTYERLKVFPGGGRCVSSLILKTEREPTKWRTKRSKNTETPPLTPIEIYQYVHKSSLEGPIKNMPRYENGDASFSQMPQGLMRERGTMYSPLRGEIKYTYHFSRKYEKAPFLSQELEVLKIQDAFPSISSIYLNHSLCVEEGDIANGTVFFRSPDFFVRLIAYFQKNPREGSDMFIQKLQELLNANNIPYVIVTQNSLYVGAFGMEYSYFGVISPDDFSQVFGSAISLFVDPQRKEIYLHLTEGNHAISMCLGMLLDANYPQILFPKGEDAPGETITRTSVQLCEIFPSVLDHSKKRSDS